MHDPLVAEEKKGWIGERYDAGAGLQYLNARYYDPELGQFIQPDWFEVTQQSVGTNRYSYSFNDPVNNSDKSGNACVPCGVAAALGVIARSTAPQIGKSITKDAAKAAAAGRTPGRSPWFLDSRRQNPYLKHSRDKGRTPRSTLESAGSCKLSENCLCF